MRSKRFEQYYLANLIQNPLDTTIAAAHLIFGGVLERHPGLAICLAHGGGFLPYNLGRQVRGKLVRADVSPGLRGSVEDSFHRFYFDSVTHASSALRFLVQEAGAEHVLLGSDFPYDMGDPVLPRTIEGAGLSPTERSSSYGATRIGYCASCRRPGARSERLRRVPGLEVL